MITITQGNKTLRVTKASYDQFYRDRGFRIIEEKSPTEAPPGEPFPEVSLHEMTFNQLEEYAKLMGLNTEGIRSKKELRMLIQNNQ